MENAQKAIIMGASVFMFVVSLSIALYFYSSVSYNVDSILTSSETIGRDAEYFINREEDVTRDITKAELVMSIIDLYKSPGCTYETISVSGFGTFKRGEDYSNSNSLKNIATSGINNFIVISENFDSRAITYTSEG